MSYYFICQLYLNKAKIKKEKEKDCLVNVENYSLSKLKGVLKSTNYNPPIFRLGTVSLVRTMLSWSS